jgi:hypothetical protein
MKLLPITLLMLVPAAMASSATQSDWSGGPGTLGPVPTWDNDFWLDAGTDWLAFGQVSILPQFVCIEHLVDGAANDPICISAGDIDGDGDQDIVGSTDVGGLVWWENTNGAGTAWTKHLIEQQVYGYSEVSLADINGDGDVDVLGALWSLDAVAWWENEDGSGATWIKHTIDGLYQEASSATTDDIDGDGDLDVLGTSESSSDITWWENMDGSGTAWAEHTIDGDFASAVHVSTDDIDGDGSRDVLGAGYGSGEIAWWANEDGVGTSWVKHTVSGLFDGASCVDSGDLDGDGDIDILGTALFIGTVAWWENTDGIGTVWEEHTIDSAFESAFCLDVDDLDGDGDLDVMASAYDADRISWWENVDGTGVIWVEHVVDDAFDFTYCVESGDIDGDGNKEILGSAYHGDMVAWWDLTSYAPSATLESSILYTGCDPDWGTLLWSSSSPPGTSVAFQVRASDDYIQMGAWSDTLSTPCSLHGLLADNASYIQYRAILETADPDTTPSLLDVTVTWDPLGIGDFGSPEGFFLSPVTPNPAGPIPSVSFGLIESGFAEISVYDISGRLVQGIGPVEYQAGCHTIQLQRLCSGIHFITMQAGEFSATQRFAVIE